ncbi:MAG TPA: CDP-diacylglycerol--serine O-phosphatidyltransferase [Ignavibacteriaceae bacterium]|nr:CDP-diacylglycerol--serine O-phosphatidyltransferase [Ignavibacteriaceae bacterium]
MKPRFRVTRSVIPNLFTAMNMFAGFLSIINASQGNYHYAAWLIIIAAIFDALDGAVARLTKSSSELGVELDSLSDVVSFGAAPAFLIYQTYLFSFDTAGVLIAASIVLAGGFRLARFNVQLVGFDKSYFTGLPIPISAFTISSFILSYYKNPSGFASPYSEIVIPLVLLLSLLMVSRIKYDTIPKPSKEEFKKKPFIFLLTFFGLIAALFTQGKAIFFIFVLFILFGIFRYVFSLFIKKN